MNIVNNPNSASTANNHSAKEETVDLKSLLFKILKKWYWFALSVFICGIIAVLYIVVTPKEYQTDTTILIRDDDSGGLFSQLSLIEGLSGLGGLGGGTSRQLEDEMQIMISKTLLSKLIRDLDIQTEYYEKQGVKRYNEIYPNIPLKLITPPLFNDTTSQTISFILSKKKNGYEINYKSDKISEKYFVDNLFQPFNTPSGIMKLEVLTPLDDNKKYKIISQPIQELAEFYIEEITVSTANKKTNALIASFTSTNRDKAKDILNTLINTYRDAVLDDKNLVSDYTASYISKQIDLTKEELANLEIEVEKYKKANSIIDISTEAKVALEMVSEYEKKLIEIETQISIITFVDQLVKDKKNQYNLIPASLGGIQEEALLLLIATYNEELLQRTQMLRTTNIQNPVITQLESRLSSLRENIILSIANVLEGLNLAKSNLLDKDAEIASRMGDVPTMERQFIEIKRMQEVKQTMFLFLLQKQYENELTMEATTPPVRIVDAAYSSLTPVAPKTLILLLVAIIIGVVIPLVTIVLSDFINNKINSEKEFIYNITPPYLGRINLSKNPNTLVVRKGEVNKEIELFKSLRTNLLLSLSEKKSPVILVSSSIEGEGKSYISINLASALTLLNKKVIIIDLNLQNPALSDYLQIRREQQGITQYLSDESIALESIITTLPSNSNLSVIQSGNISQESHELLYSERLDKMIAELKKSYDYIILDSTPVYESPETYLLNRITDSTIYISRLNYSSKELIFLQNDLYESNRLNDMHAVLNGVKDEKLWF